MLQIIKSDNAPNSFLPALNGREISLWFHQIPQGVDLAELIDFIGLPWRDVFISETDNAFRAALSTIDKPDMVRRRGYAQIIRTDPTLLSLPPRALPIYLLDGGGALESQFDKTLRRMAILGGLRRSGVRQLLVISDEDATLPPELADLIDAQFRPVLTQISETKAGEQAAEAWVHSDAARPTVQFLKFSPGDFIKEINRDYAKIYPFESTVVRFRNLDGTPSLIDLSEADDAERPILRSYDLIQERDLAPVAPQDLSESEFIEFFEGGQNSWRPWAAELPWLQDRSVPSKLKSLLGELDTVGPSENKIAFISSEPGAGGTTLARSIALESARAGYPTLVAKPIPFTPEALPVVGFLTRAHHIALEHAGRESNSETRTLYETPWVIVFDRAHFDRREGELRHFLNELTRSGRPAIILAVTGPTKPLEFYDSVAQEVATPTHFLDSKDAEALGRHLNLFLKNYGKARAPEAWSQFYKDHGVDHMHGVAAFWVTLSFWLRISRDISGSVQDWVYAAFKEQTDSEAVRLALIEIAALSSERLPLNEALLPASDNQWPLALRLEDQRKNLAALGLMTVKADGEQYWGLAHDILGRLLLNALFYDFQTRSELGFGSARDPEHLRFLALKRVAIKPAVAEVRHRALAEQFPTTIFKIDPDHGARAFATIWREVLEAFDEMPKLFRDSSRVFRHHSAISRRRISALDPRIFGISTEDREALLGRAIEDIRYALFSIDKGPGDEPDLNLYNSLANAYLNLADALASNQGDRERIAELRDLASDATHRAYSDNPTNPWVVETHIKNLLSIARAEPERAVQSALEALLAVYDAIRASDVNLRAAQLGRLAEDALTILFSNSAAGGDVTDLQTPVDVLVATWRVLSSAGVSAFDETLSRLPYAEAERALSILADPAGSGDMQVLKLRYGILSSAHPFAFAQRLGLVENLQATDGRLSPQLRLEYALLLYQVGRAREADRAFRDLRRIWRDSEHFVNVTEPLNWLRDGEGESLKTVQARVSSDQGFRPQARVSDLADVLVPFRPEEFGVRNLRPGSSFRARISFGHNGPFLRPALAGPRRD